MAGKIKLSCIVICDAHCCLFAGGSGLVMMARGLFLNMHFLLMTPMTCARHILHVSGLESLMCITCPRVGKKLACMRWAGQGHMKASNSWKQPALPGDVRAACFACLMI